MILPLTFVLLAGCLAPDSTEPAQKVDAPPTELDRHDADAHLHPDRVDAWWVEPGDERGGALLAIRTSPATDVRYVVEAEARFGPYATHWTVPAELAPGAVTELTLPLPAAVRMHPMQADYTTELVAHVRSYSVETGRPRDARPLPVRHLLVDARDAGRSLVLDESERASLAPHGARVGLLGASERVNGEADPDGERVVLTRVEPPIPVSVR